MLFANVCAGFIRPCHGVGGERGVLGILGVLGCSWGFCVFGEVLALLGFLSCPQDVGYAGVPVAGHAHWGHYLRGPLGVHWVLHQRAGRFRDCSGYYDGVMLYMLASVRLNSLRGYCAYMVFWTEVALLGNCMQNLCGTSFSHSLCFFSVLSELVGKVLGSGSLAFVDRLGQESQGPGQNMLLLRFLIWEAGYHMGIWFWRPRLTFLQLLSIA